MRNHTPLAVVLGLLLAGCSAAPPAPTAQFPTPAATPAATPAPAASDAATPGGGPGGSTGGTATVSIGGQTFQLRTGDPPVCSLSFGIQASMSSEDRRAGLDLYTTPANIGSFLFSRVLDGEVWQPAENPPPFEISGSRATWSGTMRERDGREAQLDLELTCGG